MSKANKKAVDMEGAVGENGASRIILKVLATIGITVVGIAVVFLLLCIFGVKSNMNLAGYSLHLVNDKTSAVLPDGSLYISKSVERGRSYIENDAIVFTDENNIETAGRILRIEATGADSSEDEQEDEAGSVKYVVMTHQGEQVIDEVQLWATIDVYVPYIGYVIDFIVTPLGLVCCVAVPLFILLVVEIINLIRLPKSLKGEDEEDLEKKADRAGKRRSDTEKKLGGSKNVNEPQLLPTSEESFFSTETSVKQDTVSSVLSKKSEEQGIPFAPPVASMGILSAESSSLIEELGDEALTAVEKSDVHSISYEKPKEVAKPDINDLQLTREYSIVLTSHNDNEAEKKSLFSADLREESPNHFKIEGIDVNVESDSIKLSVDEALKGRDIAITVAKDYTNVIVGGAESQIDFALFRDENDDEQKVIIRKKSK